MTGPESGRSGLNRALFDSRLPLRRGEREPMRRATLKYHLFENIMENGAFALLEQMLHLMIFNIFKIIQNLFFFLIFQSCLKSKKFQNDVRLEDSMAMIVFWQLLC